MPQISISLSRSKSVIKNEHKSIVHNVILVNQVLFPYVIEDG